jgi:hypothetical protein
MAQASFGSNMINNMFQYSFNTYNSTPYGLSAYGSGVITTLHIMKGTVPTNFSTLTTYNARSSDVLVSFVNNYSSSTNDINGSTIVGQDFQLTTKTKTATASGTATWFWWFSLDGYSNAMSSQGVLGTIGLVGSGADLEIPSVDIVAGNPYRISNVVWRFPTTLTYS